MAGGAPFVHLHAESDRSFPDGLCRVEALAEAAARAGQPAIALTDRDTLFAAVEFHQAARARGVKPILGCDIAVRAPRGPPVRLTLLAESLEGWSHLVRLVSHAHLDGPPGSPPAIDPTRLDAWNAGLLALAGGPDGPLARPDPDAAARAVGPFLDIFGPDRLFAEQRLDGRRPAPDPALDAIAHDCGLNTVVSVAVQYVGEEAATAHRAIRGLRGAGAGAPDGLPFLDPADVRRRCPDHAAALARTAEIASRCTVALPLDAPLEFPRFEVPADFAAPEGPPGARPFAFLAHSAAEGLRARGRLRDPDRPADAGERAVAERLRRELEIIRRTGFVNYFLVVADFVRFARERGIAVGPGRGSGAGSLVAYALGITGIDPLRFGLVFERFLNPERVSPPDFDIDFSPERRGAVIEYLRRRYGPDRVAHIVAFQRLGARSAVREAARALGLPAAAGDRWARRIPDEAALALERALGADPALRRDLEADPDGPRLLRLARALEGLPRHTATHPAGIVIGAHPLAERVPLMRDRDGEALTQFDHRAVARIGLLKMDLLGLTTLRVIEEAAGHVAAAEGAAPDLERLPLDDADTLALLNRGDTIGVFQLESEGMRSLLRRVRIERFEDLAALLALYRPGPAHWLDAFVRRQRGEEAPACAHPLLAPILAETRGIMLYQEQVQQAAQALAGFSLAQGDRLRRAMSGKDPDEMAALRAAFVEGCRTVNGIDEATAGRVFESMERFAGYGFNKAHAVAYAVLSYRCAWLKAHGPAAFMAAWLSNQGDDPDRLRLGMAELRALGCPLLPPTVNGSGARFRPEDGAIRYGLVGIRHIGVAAAEAIVEERARGGPFGGLIDFCARLDGAGLNRTALEALVKAGAFDGCGTPRARLLAGLDVAIARAARLRADRETGQMTLFEAEATADSDDALPEDEGEWTEAALLAAEHEVLGACLSGHPLARHAWLLRRSVFGAGGEEGAAWWAGLVARLQPARRRGGGPRNDRIALETLDGIEELSAPPGALSGPLAWLREGAAARILARPPARRAPGRDGESQDSRPECLRVEPLDALPPVREVRFHVGAAHLREETLAGLHQALAAHPGPAPASLLIDFPGGERVSLRAGDPAGVAVSEAMVRAAERVLGEQTVYFDLDLEPDAADAQNR